MSESYTYNRNTEDVKCPYCECSNDMTEIVQELGEHLEEYMCQECENIFNVGIYISISVTATRREAANKESART